MRRPIWILLISALALVTAGCGGPGDGSLKKSERIDAHSAGESTSTETTETNVEDDQPGKVDGDEASGVDLKEGKSLFNASCAGCHTLADAGATGAVGPSLDGLGWTAAKIEAQIENGSGAMPPGLATGEDATTIAEYVAAVAKK